MSNPNESIVSTPLTTGATDWSLSFTGGTPIDIIPVGDNANFLGTTLGTGDFLSRTSIEFKTRQPSATNVGPSGYTQSTSEAIIKMPITLPDGGMTYNTCRITFRFDVSTTNDQKREMRSLAAQIVCQPQFNRFIKLNSVG